MVYWESIKCIEIFIVKTQNPWFFLFIRQKSHSIKLIDDIRNAMHQSVVRKQVFRRQHFLHFISYECFCIHHLSQRGNVKKCINKLSFIFSICGKHRLRCKYISKNDIERIINKVQDVTYLHQHMILNFASIKTKLRFNFLTHISKVQQFHLWIDWNVLRLKLLLFSMISYCMRVCHTARENEYEKKTDSTNKTKY